MTISPNEMKVYTDLFPVLERLLSPMELTQIRVINIRPATRKILSTIPEFTEVRGQYNIQLDFRGVEDIFFVADDHGSYRFPEQGFTYTSTNEHGKNVGEGYPIWGTMDGTEKYIIMILRDTKVSRDQRSIIIFYIPSNFDLAKYLQRKKAEKRRQVLRELHR